MPRKRKMLIPDTHLIDKLVNAELPERHVTAFKEFISNAIGEDAGNAKEVIIGFDNKQIVIKDNGEGVQDMNTMFGIAYSRSRFSSRDIGQYGCGAKDAAIYLAWKMKVSTYYAGNFHTKQVNWKEVRDSGRWPQEYTEPGKSLSGRGTTIVLTNRHKGRIWQGEALAENLAHIFRPALLAGKNISVVDYRGRNHMTWVLRKFLSDLHLENKLEVAGSVKGMNFRLKAGTMENLKGRLNGVHIGFGLQFITKETHLIKRHIPTELYCEVMLAPEWKSSLAANKTSLSHNREELLAEIEKLLAPLIDELETKVFQIKVRGINSLLSIKMNKVIDIINEKEKGTKKGGAHVDVTTIDDRGGHRKTPKIKEKQEAIDGGQFGSQKAKLTDKGVEVACKPIGYERVYAVDPAKETRSIVVTLNQNIPSIKERYNRKDEPGLFETIIHALLDACVLNIGMTEQIFPQFKDLNENALSKEEAKQKMLYKMYDGYDELLKKGENLK